MTDDEKEKIDKMSQYEMAYLWRFGEIGEPLLQGDTGEYFTKIFIEKGWFTIEISKSLGWKKKK
jgi:hypothetical protein